MAQLALHFRSSPNLMQHGPGEVVAISLDGAAWAESSLIDFLLRLAGSPEHAELLEHDIDHQHEHDDMRRI